jgi:hypothetical protein
MADKRREVPSLDCSGNSGADRARHGAIAARSNVERLTTCHHRKSASNEQPTH